MKTLKLRDIVYAGAAFASVTLAGTAWAETKLVYAGYISERSIATTLDTWFMDQVEERSGGDITFEDSPMGGARVVVSVPA